MLHAACGDTFVRGGRGASGQSRADIDVVVDSVRIDVPTAPAGTAVLTGTAGPGGVPDVRPAQDPAQPSLMT